MACSRSITEHQYHHDISKWFLNPCQFPCLILSSQRYLYCLVSTSAWSFFLEPGSWSVVSKLLWYSMWPKYFSYQYMMLSASYLCYIQIMYNVCICHLFDSLSSHYFVCVALMVKSLDFSLSFVKCPRLTTEYRHRKDAYS